MVGSGFLIFIFPPVGSRSIDLKALAIAAIAGATALGIMGFALRGIHQRKPYGRWLSLIFLMILVVGAWDDLGGSGAMAIALKAFSQGQLPPIEGRLTDDFSYDNDYPIYRGYADLARHALKDLLSAVLRGLLPGCLAIRLVFSRAVKDFFRQG
jgi:hypothetical protein